MINDNFKVILNDFSVSSGTDKPNSAQLLTASLKADGKLYSVKFILVTACITEQNTPAESYLYLKSSAITLPSSSAEWINHALSKHQLQNFVISNNRLNILELIGEGKSGMSIDVIQVVVS